MSDATYGLWIDPLAFDLHESGPPYLPERREKLGSRSTVMGTLTSLMGDVHMAEMGALTALLRAAVMMHQTHHWQTHGATYYGDHLLFERLYNDSVGFIDQLAERAIGSGSRDLVCPKTQSSLISRLVFYWTQNSSDDPSPSDMVTTSLRVVRCVKECIEETLKTLDNKGQLTHGTDNLLQGIADKHEEFLYLLQQRSMSTAERVASRYVKTAIEFPNQAALDDYLHEHPDADPKNHSVKDHSKGEDRSDHSNVVEYGVQTMMKGKSPAAAAKDLVKKFHGQQNMFFGPGPTHLDAKRVEEALWGRLVEFTVKGMKSYKPEKNHRALGGTLYHFNQKQAPKMREELKKRIVKSLGKDPFEHDDGT